MARVRTASQIDERLLDALTLTRARLAECEASPWMSAIEDAIYECRLGMIVRNLEKIGPIMKVLAGYDPLERDTRPKGEKQPAYTRSVAQPKPSLQDLRRKIYLKAKSEESWRFWGLYVHVCKLETLHAAYKHAKENNGSPGIDGVTFEAVEAGGVDQFVGEIRKELCDGTYRPMAARKVQIPKGGGKYRGLSIPTIRDRVVQGALKLVLEPIFEADFQPGSFGYRPRKKQHDAIQRVSDAIVAGKTYVIDLDLKSYFDTVRHHIVLEKVGRRVKDGGIMRLLKQILKASGKRGVPQGGVISPLLSNIYLNEIDAMLERAKEVTRTGRWTALEYVRFADDMVILVDGHPRHRWLRAAVETRLREELATIQVEVNEEKTRRVDLGKGESFGFLGFRFARIRSRRGRWMPLRTPLIAKRTDLIRRLKGIFRRFRSQPLEWVIEKINPMLAGWVNYFRIGHSSRCFSYLRDWVNKKIRRHLAHARKRGGFGWKRWSRTWLYETYRVFDDYRVAYYRPGSKVAPA